MTESSPIESTSIFEDIRSATQKPLTTMASDVTFTTSDATSPAIENTKYFHPIDYVVFGAMLILSASIGVFFAIRSRRKRSYSTGDYLMASRAMSYGPVALSLIASFMSSVTILGVPAEYYVYGTMFTWFALLYLILPFIMIAIYIPVFYDLGIASAYEYLEMRFDKITRLIVTSLYLLLSVLYGGIVTYGPSLALSRVTGLNMWGSILCTGAVCMFYTTLGGLKAVIWTDVLQAIIMLSGFFVVIIQGCIQLGGFSNVWEISKEGERLDFIHFEADPRIRHTFWSVMIGGAILWTSIYGVNQSQVQRYISCKTKRDAYISMFISGIGLVVILILAGMTGLTMYAIYKDCDPLDSKQVERSDQLFPYAIMDIAGHLRGVPGLFVAAVYSSSLSTISSGINAMSCVTIEDFIRPSTDWRELTYTRISRLLILIYGLSYILVAYLASQIGGLIRMAYSVHGLLGAPVLGIFTIGMMTRWVNHWGAIAGLVAGSASTVWLFIGQTLYPVSAIYTRPMPRSIEGCKFQQTSDNHATVSHVTSAMNVTIEDMGWDTTAPSTVTPDDRPPIAEFYALSYLHIATVGFFTTVIVAMLVSLCTGRMKKKPPAEELLMPLMRSEELKHDADTGKGRYSKAVGAERSTSWVQTERLLVRPPSDFEPIDSKMFMGVPDNMDEIKEEEDEETVFSP